MRSIWSALHSQACVPKSDVCEEKSGKKQREKKENVRNRRGTSDLKVSHSYNRSIWCMRSGGLLSNDVCISSRGQDNLGHLWEGIVILGAHSRAVCSGSFYSYHITNLIGWNRVLEERQQTDYEKWSGHGYIQKAAAILEQTDKQTDSVTRTVGVARSLSAMTSGSPGAQEKRSPDSQQCPTTTNFPVASLSVSFNTTIGCWAPYLNRRSVVELVHEKSY